MPRPARPWFRFYVEAIWDRKLRRLPPGQRWLWVVVLACARQSVVPGVLLISEDQPVEPEDLVDAAALRAAEVEAGLAAFVDAAMLHFDIEWNAWRITKWDARQYEGDFSRLSISDGVRRAVLERDGAACLECGAVDELTIDHIVPVTKGGGDDVDNLQILCKRCNSRKGNRIRQRRYRSNARNGEVTEPERDESRRVASPETETEANTELETPLPPASGGLR